MASAKKTQDHKKIQEWVEKHGGTPAVVKSTEDHGEGIGLLRIKFDRNEENLREVEWDEFFDTFDNNELTFLYQEDSAARESRFFKFVRE